MKPTIYIDGQAGTTGLQIYQRLGDRDDITLLSIDPSKRKDASERKKLLNAADLVFLCLPDAASVEAVSLIDNPNTRVIAQIAPAVRVAVDVWLFRAVRRPEGRHPRHQAPGEPRLPRHRVHLLHRAPGAGWHYPR